MLDWKSLLYTDKPMSLSVKNFLIRKMSTAIMMSEKTITSVIDHQFVSLLENMSTCNSLELSGFGKFLFNKNKAIVTMQDYIKGLANFKSELTVCTEPQEIKRIEFR